MTDSVAVFPPGYRMTDSATGAPIPGAMLDFYDAGTTNPKSVYADKDLSVSLGTTVICDSLGCPTSDGVTKTDIFVGTAPYKIVIKDADGNTIETKDDRPGAVVSASTGDVSVIATRPVVTKSLDYAITLDDQSTTFAGNCSSGSVVFTLPSAVDAGNGWYVTIQHAGSANQCIIKTVSGQLISEGSKSFGGQFPLIFNGEDAVIESDGGNWRIVSHTPPFIKFAQGILPITDRLSAPPVSPVPGALYIVTASPTGAWSTFTAGDIAQYTGAGWINYTPSTDCGWIAFVADEDLYYEFQDSAWVSQAATATFAGRLKVANQAAQETAAANDTGVTPGTQQYHPSAAKFWLYATVATGTPTLAASYNMTSITDTGVGQLTATIGTDFSSANWAPAPSTGNSAARVTNIGSITGGSIEIDGRGLDNSLNDPVSWSCAGFGDQ